VARLQNFSIRSLISAVLRRGLGLAGTVKKLGVVGRLGCFSCCGTPSSPLPTPLITPPAVVVVMEIVVALLLLLIKLFGIVVLVRFLFFQVCVFMGAN
jgi:hypothetical protein